MHKIVSLALVVFLLQGCSHIPKMVWKNIPSVHDKNPEVRIPAAGEPCYFESEIRPLDPPRRWMWSKDKSLPLSPEKFLRKTGTDAFVVVKGDSLLYEYYGRKYSRTTRFNTHSVSKAVLSTLTAIAFEEGVIRSLDQPVTDYLPELQKKVSPELRIGDLLQMTSGLNFSELYINPFSSVTRMYFGRHTEKFMKRIHQRSAPGVKFAYRSSNSWLLARVLERATGMPLAEYTHVKLWEPLCVPADAGWKLDRKKGNVLGFAGFNTSAYGLARIGQLYANSGVWKQERILPESWISSILDQDTVRGAAPFYQLAWFPDRYYGDFFAEGLFYQYLYVHPESKTVIVRIGDRAQKKYDWRLAFRTLSGAQHKPEPLPVSKDEIQKIKGTYVFGKMADGDSTLAGRRIKISGRNNYLSVKILRDSKEIRKRIKGVKSTRKFKIFKENEYLFYDNLTYRTLTFNSDYNSISWKRKDNVWNLIRVGVDNSKLQ